jgi:hypothetical protein
MVQLISNFISIGFDPSNGGLAPALAVEPENPALSFTEFRESGSQV